MNELGYIRVAAASPEVRPADVDFNISEIKRLISDAADKGSDIVLFRNFQLPATLAPISSSSRI